MVQLRLQFTYRSIIFFKSGFLGQNVGLSMTFNFFLKKMVKKTKYWRRNRSFTFTPEEKMLCNQPRDDFPGIIQM